MAGDVHAEPVGVKASEGLDRGLGDAVVGVGARRDVGGQGCVAAAVEAGGVVTGGEDDPAYAGRPRGLQDGSGAVDVGM
jgi:hypothetical protein